MTEQDKMVQEFIDGAVFYQGHKKVIKLHTYSCAPARIDGMPDTDTVAICLEGEIRITSRPVVTYH